MSISPPPCEASNSSPLSHPPHTNPTGTRSNSISTAIPTPVIHYEEDHRDDDNHDDDEEEVKEGHEENECHPIYNSSSSSYASSLYSPPLLNSTSLALILQFLPFASHIQAARSSRHWYDVGCSRLAWSNGRMNTFVEAYLPPYERRSKMLYLNSYRHLLACVESRLTRYVQTICLELTFDFLLPTTQLLTSFTNLTSLTIRASDERRICPHAIQTLFNAQMNQGWNERIHELCIGVANSNAAHYAGGGSNHLSSQTKRYSSSTTSAIAISTTRRFSSTLIDSGYLHDEGSHQYSLDHLVTNLHLITRYLPEMPNLEILCYPAWHHLDYTHFDELHHLQHLHTLIISPTLPYTMERVHNLRRLPNLTYLDWRGDTGASEEAIKQPHHHQHQHHLKYAPNDIWSVLLAPLESDIPNSSLPSLLSKHIHTPTLALHTLHIHGVHFTVHHLGLLPYHTLQVLHFSARSGSLPPPNKTKKTAKAKKFV